MPRGQWNRRRGNDRGLAEIVGTLMLVLIVVSAAVAFSFFVASYQAQLQSEETLTHNQELESLKVLGVAPGKVTGGIYDTLNITLVSEYINPSYVNEIQVNDQPLKAFNATFLNLSTGHFQTQSLVGGQYMDLSPQEDVTIEVTFVQTSLNYSFYVPFTLGTNQYVKIDAYTSLDNVFSRAFLPPTAIAVVTNTTSSTGSQTTLLDGSQSFQPEGNATLVSWTWTVTANGGISPLYTLTGEEAQTPYLLNNTTPTDNPYTVLLTVTNSDGLSGQTTVKYYAGAVPP